MDLLRFHLFPNPVIDIAALPLCHQTQLSNEPFLKIILSAHAFISPFQHTDNAYYVCKSIVHNSFTLISRKTWQDSNPGLRFLRRMRRPMLHADFRMNPYLGEETSLWSKENGK
jgi:hypothetical protein